MRKIVLVITLVISQQSMFSQNENIDVTAHGQGLVITNTADNAGTYINLVDHDAKRVSIASFDDNYGDTNFRNAFQFFGRNGKDIRFATSGDATAGSNKFTITNAGDVGIGTTSPSTKLEVAGVIKTYTTNENQYLKVYGGNSGNFIDSYGTNFYLRSDADNSKSIILKSSGEVGIGTTSPKERLHVFNGNMMISSGTNSNNTVDRGIRFTTDNTNYYSSINTYRGTASTAIGLQFQTMNGSTTLINALNISPSGEVGIGTTSPKMKLEVKDGDFGILGLNTSRYIRFTENDSYQGSYINYDGTANVLNIGVHENNNDDLTLDKNAISIVRSTGNVGIGTTSPTENLSVYGNTARLSITGQSGHSAIMLGNQDSLGVDNPAIIHAANGNLYFGGGDSWNRGGSFSTSMNVADNGNVGIGTGMTTPNGKLNIINTATIGGSNLANASILLGNTGSGMGIDTNEILTKGLDLYLGTITEGNDLYLRTGGQERVFIDGSSGNVGIGKTDPKNKLSVNGTIWATKVIVKLTDGADWVFEDDYELRPLSEVENFIKENKHLPEIPSADEFRANDMEVSEMTNKLLQKIEELTLYTIAQEKEIQDLQSVKVKNEELEARLEKIEALLVK